MLKWIIIVLLLIQTLNLSAEPGHADSLPGGLSDTLTNGICRSKPGFPAIGSFGLKSQSRPPTQLIRGAGHRKRPEEQPDFHSPR